MQQQHPDWHSNRIEIRRVPGAIGIEALRYEWLGGEMVWCDPYLVADYDKRRPQTGDVFIAGPYRLRVIEWDILMGAALVMRDGWRARWYAAFYGVFIPPTDRFYRRVIMTLSVWGLADWRFNEDLWALPTWRNIHILRRIARQFENKH